MRLSSSLKLESAALDLGFENLDTLGLAVCDSGILVGVCACFGLGGSIVDFEDNGVSVSMLSNPKFCCCL